jgi:membrane dipeptidase
MTNRLDHYTRTHRRALRGLNALAAGLIMSLATTAFAADPVPVMDLHSDILLRVIDNNVDIAKPPAWVQTSIPTMREGHVTDQVFAVWVDSGKVLGLDATQRALRMIDCYWAQEKLHGDQFGLALDTRDAARLRSEGKIAVYLWLEGGAPLNNDLAMLRTFHRLGIRGMTLTWTDNLMWAGASTDKVNPAMGLSDLGKDVVREMNRLNMIVDLSHVSDQTFYDTLELMDRPVLVSHSGCRALCKHPRNVTDDMLKALAKNGGVIGINALPEYLSDDWGKAWTDAEAANKDKVEALKQQYKNETSNPEYREARRVLLQSALAPEQKVTLDTFLDHIDHAAKVAGVEHVGLGADFDGIWAFPEGLEKASKWQSVTEGLRKRGYTEDQVKGIMGDNARRVFAAVLDR